MAEGGPNRRQSFSAVVSQGMLCQLYMHDSRGDGWQGAEWSGLGQDGLTLEDGFEKTFTFVVPHLPLQLTGPCSLTDDGSCATSPNYPESYGNSEECIITRVPLVELEVVAFDVEASGFCVYDYLTVNGKKYCGSSGPEGVVVVENGIIEWVSDSGVVKSGWKARPRFSRRPLSASRLMPFSPLPDLLGDPAAIAAFAASTAAFAAINAAIAASTTTTTATAALTTATTTTAVIDALTTTTAAIAAFPAAAAASPAAAADSRLCRCDGRGSAPLPYPEV